MKKLSSVLIITFSLLLNNPILGASFDCSQAQSNTEKAICANEYLSALDDILSGFYTKIRSNSLNEKALKAQQIQWLKERNKCNDNTQCLQKVYQARIQQLTIAYKNIAFSPIEKSELAYILENQGKTPVAETHTSFIAKDNYWEIRPLFNRYSQLNKVLQQEYHFTPKSYPSISLEGYRFEKGILYVYAKLWYRQSNASPDFLVEFTDHLPPKIIAKLDGSGSFLSTSATLGPVTYYTKEKGDQQKIQINEWVSDTNRSVPITGIKPEDYKSYLDKQAKKTEWMGMCGDDVCYSYNVSPNNIWQVATKTSNDAIYLFPNNKPNDGMMIIENFNPNIKELADEGGSMDRSVTWLDDNTLFFDNASAYVCIWRVDIKQKIVEKIIPFHDVQLPFPIKINNQEYLLFVVTQDSRTTLYIARPPYKK